MTELYKYQTCDVFFTQCSASPLKLAGSILFADLVAMPGVPHPIPFRTRSLSPPGPMVLRLKARESRSPPGPLKGCPLIEPQNSQSPTLPHDQHTLPRGGAAR